MVANKLFYSKMLSSSTAVQMRRTQMSRNNDLKNNELTDFVSFCAKWLNLQAHCLDCEVPTR